VVIASTPEKEEVRFKSPNECKIFKGLYNCKAVLTYYALMVCMHVKTLLKNSKKYFYKWFAIFSGVIFLPEDFKHFLPKS
jgi:hypothetical protein